MPWSRPFDKPIQLPQGKKLVTLKDAAAYILKLPKSEQQSPEWQAAAEAVMMAAEDRGPLMHAHVGMMLALHGATPIPEYNPAKVKIGTAEIEAGRVTEAAIARPPRRSLGSEGATNSA
jgi:hypothetical protein